MIVIPGRATARFADRGCAPRNDGVLYAVLTHTNLGITLVQNASVDFISVLCGTSAL
jgi:hypothetical protein